MIKKIYYYTVTNHDWFEHYGAQLKPDTKEFELRKEAFASWKVSKSKDFYWPEDHERYTTNLSYKFVYQPDLTPEKTNKSEKIWKQMYNAKNDYEYHFLYASYLNQLDVEKNKDTYFVKARLHGWDGSVYETTKISVHGALWNWYIAKENLLPDPNQNPYKDKYIDFYTDNSKSDIIIRSVVANAATKAFNFNEEDIII